MNTKSDNPFTNITTRKRVINEETGEWVIDCYDEVKLKVYEVDLTKSKIAKQYSAYDLMNYDLLLMLNWTRKLKQITNAIEKANNIDITKQYSDGGYASEALMADLLALFSALIIHYGRLFNGNTRGAKLDTKKHVNPTHFEIHKRLLDLRNKYIAHSSGIGEEDKIFIVKKNEESVLVLPYLMKEPCLDSTELNKIEILLINLIEVIKSEIQKIGPRLSQEYLGNTLVTKEV